MQIAASIVTLAITTATAWTGTLLALTDAATSELIQVGGVILSTLITAIGGIVTAKVLKDSKRDRNGDD